ncbi:unnamed protein product [Symbiodinium sp. CCMP2592]|nr:unnamed protein product [Symbiodinium sp. CCMP2592]CAE7402894.1 unnamed protein product [Symbiodinium sp. CCMP2592]
MRNKSFKSGRFDKKYNQRHPGHRSNFMDINDPSGFLLACYFILRGCPDNFFAMFAVMCSSFTKMNAGTSKRSKCSSMGFDAFPSVSYSNKLLERSVLLIYLVTALGGTWFLEQPSQSVLEYYPTFRKMLLDLFNVQGGDAVFDTRWWMCQYGAPTPKRHYAYSNSDKIYLLNQGKLYVKCGQRSQTVSRKRNAEGKQCYTGAKHLRPTECPGCCSCQVWNFGLGFSGHAGVMGFYIGPI